MENSNDLFADWQDADATPLFEKTVEKAELKEEIKQEKEKDTPVKTIKEEAESDEDGVGDIFKSFTDEGDEDEEKPSGLEELKKESSTMVLLQQLKTKGLVEYEIEEGEELSDEEAEELLEESMEAALDKKLESMISEFSDEARDVMKFLSKGGNITEYISKVVGSGSTGLTEDLDLELEKNQILVIRASLVKEGHDEEEIEDRIDYLKSSGKLKLNAEKKFDKWLEGDKEAKKNLVRDQEERLKAVKKQRKELKEDFSTFVSNTKEISSFKLNKKDVEELPNYITDPSVKLENGNYITPLQKKLQEVFQDKGKTVLLAKLLKSDFDFSSLEKNISTKITQEVKNSVRRKSPQTTDKVHKSLASYFD